MAVDGDRARAMPDPVGSMVQAAASLSAALWRQMLATVPDSTGVLSEPAVQPWAQRVLAPYQQFLGSVAIAGTVPKMLERIVQVMDPPAGGLLLFRARPRAGEPSRKAPPAVPQRPLSDAEQAFYRFIEAIETASADVLMTPGLSHELDELRRQEAFATSLVALQQLSEDPRRADLPRLLDELKHDVRKSRVHGFQKVYDSLRWLLESDATKLAGAYDLLDSLSDLLGERCLQAIRSHRLDDRMLSSSSTAADWEPHLRQCFASFGLKLSDRLSVVRCKAAHVGLLVLDHDLDRCFEIRRGGGASPYRAWDGGEVHGSAPGRDYTVGHRQWKLPLRDHDTCQGFAGWLVDRRLIEPPADLTLAGDKLRFRALELGADRSPVTLYFVHYRDSDVGEYYELGLGSFVAPSHDPLCVGIATLGSILVSTAQARDVGAAIWGFDKQLVQGSAWSVRYRPNRVECCVDLGDATLSLCLPRGGMPMSSSLPLLMYTRIPGQGSGQWHRSPRIRFSSGESVRLSGAGVVLSIKIRDQKALTQPLLAELYRLHIINAQGQMQATPSYSAWADQVSSQQGAPTPVPEPPPSFD